MTSFVGHNDEYQVLKYEPSEPSIESYMFLHLLSVNGRTQLFLSPTLNVAFRSFEPQIGEPFPNQQLLKVTFSQMIVVL